MTGLTFGEGLPTANWIAMGLSDGEKAINGAGSWDPEIQKLYVQGDPEATKELACESIRSSIRLLPFVYFIGGFLFQFIWEAKSRYCLPYFVFLIPVS